MFIVNQVINFNETPGLLFDSVLTTEEANQYPIGTIAFDQTTHTINRAEGTPGSQTWVGYGGGGGTQDLQSVLNTGNVASNQSITLNTDGDAGSSFLNDANLFFYKDNDLAVYLELSYEFVYIVTDDTDCAYGTNYLSFHNSINGDRITGRFDSLNGYFSLEYNEVDNGLNIDFANNLYRFGDYASENNDTKIIIDDANSEITAQTGAIKLLGGALLSASSGGNSGQHLVIYVQGNQYKIQLLDP